MTMPANPLAVRISTPVVDTLPGRGFYQLDESSLYVPIGAADRSRHYFSSLESDRVRLDIDRDGRLMFIEITAARNTWVVTDKIEQPVWAEPADIRFLGFRTTIPDPQLLTDAGRQRLMLRFSPAPVARAVSIAESVVLSVDDRNSIVSMLITEIVDDLAGREIARYRESQSEDRSPAPVAC